MESRLFARKVYPPHGMIFAPTIWYSRTNGSVYCIWSWTPFQTDPDPVKTRPVETRRFSEYQTRGFLGSMGKYHRPRLLQRRWRPAPPGQDISLVCKHRTPAQITQVPTGCQSNQSKAPFKGVESTGGPGARLGGIPGSRAGRLVAGWLDQNTGLRWRSFRLLCYSLVH